VSNNFTKTQVNSMVTTLSKLNIDRAESVYAMAQIAYAIKESRLYTILGHTSLSGFLASDDRMKVSLHQFNTHADFYKEAKRLRYSKDECIKLLERGGVSRLSRSMRMLSKKVAISALVSAAMEDEKYQINFAMDDNEYEVAEAVLEHYGLEIGQDGRRLFSSEAFNTAMAELKQLKKIRKSKKAA